MGGWARDTPEGCTVEVRVSPRSPRPGVDADPGGVRVRVRAPPEGGRATREAAVRLAAALGVAPSRVALLRGMRSRTKVLAVRGLSAAEAVRSLQDR